MNGILYIDEASADATTGHMLVTLKSGGDSFRFHLPGNVALKFLQRHLSNRDIISLKQKGRSTLTQQ